MGMKMSWKRRNETMNRAFSLSVLVATALFQFTRFNGYMETVHSWFCMFFPLKTERKT